MSLTGHDSTGHVGTGTMTDVVGRVISNGRPVGDLPETRPAHLAAGRMHPDDLVWRPGMHVALPARGIDSFRHYFRGSSLGQHQGACSHDGGVAIFYK